MLQKIVETSTLVFLLQEVKLIMSNESKRDSVQPNNTTGDDCEIETDHSIASKSVCRDETYNKGSCFWID